MHKRQLLPMLLIAAACSTDADLSGQPCPSILNFALRVTIQDARTLSESPFANVSVTAVDGDFRDTRHFAVITDSMARFGDAQAFLALGRPGTYAIKVTADGYRDWVRAGVKTVNHYACRGASDSVGVRLEPR